MSDAAKLPAYLIVNADDYGYFPCVSRGIADAARQGAVTATGILANRSDLQEQMEWPRRLAAYRAPRLLGLNESGRLTLGYFQRVLPKLRTGQAYELMCHPGYLEVAQICDARLLAYHDWQGEFELLTSPALESLFEQY